MLPFFKARIHSIASAHGERLLNTDGNGCAQRALPPSSPARRPLQPPLSVSCFCVRRFVTSVPCAICVPCLVPQRVYGCEVWAASLVFNLNHLHDHLITFLIISCGTGDPPPQHLARPLAGLLRDQGQGPRRTQPARRHALCACLLWHGAPHPHPSPLAPLAFFDHVLTLDGRAQSTLPSSPRAYAAVCGDVWCRATWRAWLTVFGHGGSGL